MALEDGEGISENRVTFYRMAGHSHDGDNSSKIDFSSYDIYDIVDGEQLKALIGAVVQNGALRTTHLTVGDGNSTIVIDGSIPAAVSNLNVTSSASTTSDGNIFIDVSWTFDADSSYKSFLVELYKSESGISGTYNIMQTVETTGLSYRFERIDNNAGDGGQLYYKAKVYVISSIGIRGVASSSSGIAPAVDTTPPTSPTFNDDFSNFDEGVKPAFKGLFIYLDENTEYDVKKMRGRYEYQVSISNVAASFDSASNLKAAGLSKSSYFLVNNLDVRASAGGTKIDYYLRIRAVDSSGNYSSWVYYKDTADGGASGAGTATDSAASAINVLEINAGVDVQANTITANEIFAGTITATEIAANSITADELSSLTITVGKYIQSSNYVSATSGWQIDGSGNAYVNNIVARGTIHATSGTIGGETTGWTIASNVIQTGSGTGTVIFSTNGAGTPFIRLGSKTSFTSANSGYWLDTANGMALGSNAWHVDTAGNMWWGTSTSYAGADTKISSSGQITFKNGSIDLGGADSTSWHVDTAGNMWWGAHATYGAANYQIANWGGAYLLYARIGGGVSGSDVETGKAWEINDGNITNVSTHNVILDTDYNAVGLNSVSGIIRTAGSKIILRGYSGGDIRMGIAQTNADQPTWNLAGDIAMTKESGNIRFSVETALLVNNGAVTVNNGLTLTGTPTNSSGSYMLSRNVGGDLIWNGSAVGGTTYTSGTGITISAADVISHTDSSALTGTQSSTGQFVKTVTVDGLGHMTGVTFGTTGSGGDHGLLTGLGDNDHPQYSLTSHAHSYLPLSGGVMTGTISNNSGIVLQGGSGASGNLRANNGAVKGVEIQGTGATKLYYGAAAAFQTAGSFNTSYQQMRSVNGIASLPSYSFTSDPDTGMYRSIADQLDFATAGSTRLNLSSAGLRSGIMGTSTNPAYSFTSSTGAGMGFRGNTTWLYMQGGSTYWGIGVGVGGHVAAALASSTGSANVKISGNVLYSLSSRRDLKENIITLDRRSSLSRIKALRPVAFNFKKEYMELGNNEMIPYEKQRGFIAEEVAEVDHWMAQWGWIDQSNVGMEKRMLPGADPEPNLEEAVPTDFNERAIMADLVASVQELESRLAALEL